jgi:hypothetical protein
MDPVSLREERTRVSDALRFELGSLGALRNRLANAKTDAGRRLLYRAVDQQSGRCRGLSARLLELDDLISATRVEQAPVAPGPLLPVAGVFPID